MGWDNVTHMRRLAEGKCRNCERPRLALSSQWCRRCLDKHRADARLYAQRRRAVAAGKLVRVARGVYVPAEATQ